MLDPCLWGFGGSWSGHGLYYGLHWYTFHPTDLVISTVCLHCHERTNNWTMDEIYLHLHDSKTVNSVSAYFEECSTLVWHWRSYSALSLIDVIVGFRCTRACELIGLDYWEHQPLGKAFSVLADVITHMKWLWISMDPHSKDETHRHTVHGGIHVPLSWSLGLMMVRSKRTPTRQSSRADVS